MMPTLCKWNNTVHVRRLVGPRLHITICSK